MEVDIGLKDSQSLQYVRSYRPTLGLMVLAKCIFTYMCVFDFSICHLKKILFIFLFMRSNF